MSRVATFFAALLFSVSSFAVPIPVHNTGVGPSDALVGTGAQTSFWELVSAPSGATEAIGSNPFRYRHPNYAPDSTTAAWVAPTAGGTASVGGWYVYDLAVDLTGFDLLSVVIEGLFSTDNNGAIRLNGGADVATTGFADFGTLHNFSITSGFVSGINHIQVATFNGGNPTAAFVQFTSATGTAIPEPASLALLGLGLLGLGFSRRKKA